MVLLAVVAKIKEKEIADIALKKISKSIHATIRIDGISLSLIRRFPLATIELKNIWFGPPDTSGLSTSTFSEEEALAKIKKVYISVKSGPLFKGEFEIMKVEIRGVDLNYIVNKKGVSNFDFLIDTTGTESTDTTSLSLDVMLKELLLRDIHCNYYDSLNVMSAQIAVSKARVNGEVRGEYLHGSANGVLKLSDCNYKATNLYLMREAKIDFNVTYSEDSVELKELAITTDGADFTITGSAVIKDTIETDLHIQGTRINIDELIKYIPEKTVEDIGLYKASGIVNMDATVKGFIVDSILPEVKAGVGMKKGYIQITGYPALKNISFAGNLTNGAKRNNSTTSIHIQKFHAETGHSSIDMSGILSNPDRIQYKINSNMVIELGEFKAYIPDTIMSGARGQILARFFTTGVLPDSIGSDFVDYVLDRSRLELTLNNLFLTLDPAMTLDSLSGTLRFDLHHITARNLHVNIPAYGVNINNTSFDAQLSGKLSEPSNLGIDLKSYQVRTNRSAFYGSAKIRDLEAPEFDISSTIRLHLSEVMDMLPDSLVNNLAGEITAQIDSRGKLNPDSIAGQINDLVFNNSTFRVGFDKVSVDMPDTLMSVHELTGRLLMMPDTIKIYNTRGIYSGIDFSIDSTKIVNLYNSVILNKASQLYVEGRFYLGDLDYAMFAPFMAESADSTVIAAENNDGAEVEITDSTATNYTYLIKGKLGVRSLTYKKAVVKNISSLFNFSDSLYLVDQLKFDGFSGKHNTSVRYEIRKGEEQMLWVKNNIENMNVTQLLEDFDNFQDFYEPAITSKNISGILSSKVDAQVYFKNDSLLRSEMRAKGIVKIEKGGIYHYPPVQDMAQNLRGIDNLDVLEFKTINTSIFIFKDAVNVPNTLIISNKLDATAFGMQSFGEDYEYHLMVFLSDILTGKSKKRIKKQNEIGDEITSAGRKGIKIKSYSEDGKSGSKPELNDKERDEMSRKIKDRQKHLELRFNPFMINYNTGVN